MEADAYNQRLTIAMLHTHNHSVLADIIGTLRSLEGQMSQLELACANYTKYMIKLLYLYVAVQAAVLTTVFSAPQQKEGCEIWRWCPLILSGLASTAMTALFLQYLVQQFSLLQAGRKLQERRDRLVEMLLNWRIRLFFAYRNWTVFQEATNCWWTAQSIAFLVMFIAFSVFLILSCTRLLC